MIDIIFGETNLGKTSEMLRWRPNAIVIGFDKSVIPQVRRVLGIIPRSVWSAPHRNGTPPSGVSHATLYKQANGLVADTQGKPMRRKFGIVRALDSIYPRVGTYDSVLRGLSIPMTPAAIEADKARVKSLYGVTPDTHGFWLIREGSPTVFSSDVGIDDAQILCRDARFAHFQAPTDLNSDVPIEFETIGNVLNQRLNTGKASHNFIEGMFRAFAQNFTDVNWTFTTHERKGGVAEVESKKANASYRIPYDGGPEFFTNNQVSFLTGYVDNSLRLTGETRDEELAAAMPWLFTPRELPQFASRLVHYQSGHPMHELFSTKQRGPFWDASPGGPQGLYRGSGSTVSADMTGFEWLLDVIDAILAALPITGTWQPTEWAKLWDGAQTAARKAFKEVRQRDIRALSQTTEEQSATFNGATTGSSFIGLTKADLTAQYSWALHEGWCAWIARKRSADMLNSTDLFDI